MEQINVLSKLANDIILDVQYNGEVHSVLIKGAKNGLVFTAGIGANNELFGKVGITKVDSDIYKALEVKFKDFSFFKNGLIRAAGGSKETQKEKEDMAKLITGTEGINKNGENLKIGGKIEPTGKGKK